MSKNCECNESKILKNDIRHIERSVDDIQATQRKHEEIFVMLVQFMPVRNAVYGMIGLFMTGIVGSLIALILK